MSPETLALIELALAVEGAPPCAINSSGECDQKAAWICHIDHYDCPETPEYAMLCTKHKCMAEYSYSVRNWPGMGVPDCDDCGHKHFIYQWDPIGGNDGK